MTLQVAFWCVQSRLQMCDVNIQQKKLKEGEKEKEIDQLVEEA